MTLVLLSTISIVGQTTITKNIGDFTTLMVYNGIDIELIKSDVQKLVITGKKAEKVFVRNGKNTLKIALKFPELLANNTVKKNYIIKTRSLSLMQMKGHLLRLKRLKS